MSNVVTHVRSDKNKKKSNGALVVIGSIVAIITILFGLNYFLTKSNKNNSKVVEKVSDAGYTMGDANAKIRIVEYSDFQCPACAGFASVFPEVYKTINEKYGSSTLSLTYKYFPLISIHPNAMLSAESAEAAKNQGKFWELGEVLFAKQDEWASALDAKSKIEGYARELGLDMAKFIQDRDSSEAQDAVNKGLAEATKLGLDHTPFVFMNGVEMKDLRLNAAEMIKTIEAKLQEMGISPINQ